MLSHTDLDVTEAVAAASAPDDPPPSDVVNDQNVAALAYELWQGRGCPIGTPEIDWFQALEQIRSQTQEEQAASAAV